MQSSEVFSEMVSSSSDENVHAGCQCWKPSNHKMAFHSYSKLSKINCEYCDSHRVRASSVSSGEWSEETEYSDEIPDIYCDSDELTEEGEEDDTSNLNLPLSPDEDSDSYEECTQKGESTLITSATSDVPRDVSSLSNDPSLPSSTTSGITVASHHYENSPDMFYESEVIIETSPHPRSTTPTDQPSSLQQHHEPEEEWSSQKLWEISQSLKVRSKQVKRLMMGVIRKKQMADESLEAFKRRLRRF